MKLFLALALTIGLGISNASADCNISDAGLEEAILKKPEFRDPANRQMVRDLRRLRDSAFILWTYGRVEACEQLLGNIRELVAAPSMETMGGSDEDEVNQQLAASEPMVRDAGAELGNRGHKDAAPLIKIGDMTPPMRADEVMGSEIRTSDDKIVGEVRDIVIGTEGRRDYAIVASGGFFVPGRDSYVVALRNLRVSQERNSFFLSVTQADLANVPLMPDNQYKWLSDDAWLAANNRFFAADPKQDRE
ncbi:MAG: PRC-barrel domain-containing protein [Aestuariivirga sp.]|nr:PRC-barrel domain-containing protein [Aestuariivirga sp.]